MAFAFKPPAPQRGATKSSPTTCGYCGEKDNFHDSAESGDRSCANCGTVLQENNIVSTVQFSESGGSSNVVGQFVSGDKGRPSGGGAGRGRGRFGHSRDSRETTIQNGKKKIIQVLAQLHLKTTLADQATRLFTLCVQQNYVQGRKTMNIVAACVYIVCRQNHFPIMLIDISDKLAVNVYVLGKTFQKLIKHLNLQTKVPIVDPAMYIKRFAAKLDLGSKTNAVCMTALKIIGSMKRDFLASGRQPAGVCCAALTLATRVNRIERSKEEIRKAVKVCDATVRKRLLEFEATPTSQLTVEELNKLPQTVAFPGVDEEAAAVAAATAAAAAGRGSGESASTAAGGGGEGAAGAAGQVSVLVSEIRMDPPAFIANRIRDGGLKLPWTEKTAPSNNNNKGVKAARGKHTANGSSGGHKKAAKKNSGDDVDASGNAAAAVAGGERRGGKRGSKEGKPGAVGEEEMVVGVVGGRRGLPRRKAAAAARKRKSWTADNDDDDDDDDDEEEIEGDEDRLCGSGDDDEHSEYSSGGENEEEEEDDEEEEEEEEEEEDSEYDTDSDRGTTSKGKGKGTAARGGRKRKKASSADSSDEEEEEEEEEEEGVRLSSKMKVDANTEEGREALTRHVLHIRATQNGTGKAKSRAKRSKVQSEVYSCLESMFDEDEERGVGIVDPAGGSNTTSNTSNTTNNTNNTNAEAQPPDISRGDSSTSGPRAAAAEGGGGGGGGGAAAAEGVAGDTQKNGAAADVGGGDDDPAGDGKDKASDTDQACTQKGGKGGDGGGKASAGAGKSGGKEEDGEDDDLEWGVYLRTEEDSDRTKREWEKEHGDWVEDQIEKERLLGPNGGGDASGVLPKKKRKYNVSSSQAASSLRDALQTEAAKSKSQKINLSALQRVMNVDGTLKHPAGEGDDGREEIFEDNSAPHGPFKGGGSVGYAGGRGKSPITSSLSSSSTPGMLRPFTGGAVLPPARPRAAQGGGKGPAAIASSGAKGRGGGGRGGGSGAGRGSGAGILPPAGVPPAAPTVKTAWARAAPDDNGESVIKDALAKLAMGGLAALPSISAVAPLAAGGSGAMSSAGGRVGAAAAVPAARVMPPVVGITAPSEVKEVAESAVSPRGAAAAAAAAPVSAVPVATETVEEVEGDEVEEAAVGGVAVGEEEEEDDDEEDDDDDDDDDDDVDDVDALYDDDDDPYGEEA